MKKIIKYFLIPLFIFIIFFTFYNNVYKKISITYWDEEAWLGRGYFFELLIKGDFNNPLWDTPLAFDQPKLTEYMYGAAIYPTYLKYKEKLSKKNIDYAQFFIDHNFFQVNGEKYEKYKENNYQFIDWEKGKFVDFDASASQLVNKYGQNFQKTIDLIFTARKINVYLLSLNVVIVYYISVFCFGLFPSLLISLLFGSNNFIIEACLKAHSEGLFLFLFNLDLLILILTVKKNRLFSILFAIVTGLLWQTKINGVMMLIIFNTVFLTKMAINWFKSNKKIVGHILLLFNVNLLTLLVFVNTNFFIMKSPIKNILIYYQERNEQSQQQAAAYPLDKLSSPKERIIAIYKNFIYDPFYFRASDFFPAKINQIMNTTIYKLIYRTSLLLGFGGVFISFFKKKKKSNIIFLLVVFFLIQLIMSQYLILNWDRYFIQISLFFIIFYVQGLVNLTKIVSRAYKNYVNKNIFKHR